MSETFAVDLNRKRILALGAFKSDVITAMTDWSDGLAAGQYIRVSDPCGKPAADFWAFNVADLDEHLSTMYTRVWVNKLCPGSGESFHADHRRPILQVIADACGVHDLLTTTPDEHRYRLYGIKGEHPSGEGNLRKAMPPYTKARIPVPQPLNPFSSFQVLPDGRVLTCAPPATAGDDGVVKARAISACPREFNPSAGWYPTDIHVTIFAEAPP